MTKATAHAGDDIEAETDWHVWETDAVLAALQATDRGLTQIDADQRLVSAGANELQLHAPHSVLRRLLRQFQNVLLYVLLGAAVLTALLAHWIDTGVILGVVIINAVIGFIQEGRAAHALDAIRQMLSPRAMVLRDGLISEIDARTVVPGDVVLLDAGSRVAADIRLLSAKDLEIDESVLTGESTAVGKRVGQTTAATPLAERSNMAFAGTLTTRGQGRGVVVATGTATALGQVTEMLAHVERLTTPLLAKISVFGRRLSGAILVLSAIIALFGVVVRDLPVTDMMLVAVGIAVAAIPEGLPPVITITLAIGVRLLARRNAIVRRLPAVETLGEVTVVCTDKTGTLTRNEMTARTVALASGMWRATGVGYSPEGALEPTDLEQVPSGDDLQALLRAGLNCNDAQLTDTDGRIVVSGDPTEAALLALAGKGGLVVLGAGDRRQRLDVIPFESEQRYMATLHEAAEDAGVVYLLYLKGAPEDVLALCTTQLRDGTAEPLDTERWIQTTTALADSGQRVLAFAMKSFTQQPGALSAQTLDRDLTFLGVVGVADPPREETADALAQCRGAGIQVKMITGDHARTAAAIAREIGLPDSSRVLTGRDLDEMPARALSRAARDVNVFARTSPEHKLWLVQALQADGQIVAMTGDGVNDAPALKRADIGVAMGKSGTEAAREAAEMVLADDDFSTIVRAVEQGRTIYDNINKSILFLLPTSVAEALVIAAAVIMGYALPITPLQILWVNMITAVTLGIALAFEQGEPAIMSRGPRPSQQAILSALALWRTGYVSLLMLAGVAAIFWLGFSDTGSLDYARTLSVNLLVLFEAVYLFSSRFTDATAFSRQGLRGNIVVWISIGSVLAFQAVYTYTTPFQTWFQTVALDVQAWLQIATFAGALLILLELEKAVRRRIPIFHG